MNPADQLRALWKEIGRPHPPNGPRDPGSYEEVRGITEEEWETIVRAVEGGFPATITSARYGFSFGLLVFEPSPPPLFPGTEEEQQPKPVLFVTAWQFPGNDPRRHLSDQKFSVHAHREGVWEKFSALCETPENLARCAREGIEAPGERGSYVY